MTDRMALHDALDAAARALVLDEAGSKDSASAMLLQASVAAAEAFDLGTPQSEALGRVLDVIAGVTAGAMA